MIEITDKANCCGCTACAQTCPVGAIEMVQDSEGFYYPNTDINKCIKCNKCNRVCPIINNSSESEYKRKVYIGQNKNEGVRFDSTSGGIFSALANYVIEKKGYVFGAEFDDNWQVVHGNCKTINGLSRFRGSKYVQSNLRDTFTEIKRILDDNQWVLFTGTPCQVEGLYSFLHKEYEKLILMDIVCYSISSPRVWKMYLEHIVKEKKLDLSMIKRIKFRDKSKYGYEYTLMTFYNQNGEAVYSSGPESNQMLRSFVSNTSTRPSCYNCQFKKINRVSDFTAWDCYNVYKYDKTLDDNKGTSHVMVHTNKAHSVIDEINGKYLKLEEVDLNKAIASEPAMTKCAIPSDFRSDFFKCIEEGNDVFDVYFKETTRVKIERIMRSVLSETGLYSFVKRSIKR